MATDKLKIYERPNLRNPRLIMGLSGWMDGGEVSTGTIGCLATKLNAHRIAEINPEGFYIYNFPGMMEIASLFRPHTRIEHGLIESFEFPHNTFFGDEANDVILLLGKEPNLQWEEFADCFFELCRQFAVKMVYFIGSVAGLVPHTRDPRLFCSVSKPELKETFQHYGIKFSDYEGPASIVTYLTAGCAERGLDMVSLVATIPAYVQGNNPKCIEAVTRRLAGILNLQIDLNDLQAVSDDFEKKLSNVVSNQPELAENIRKLEEDYDNEIFNSEMGDLKNWLQQQGIRLD
jgi:proteasome assembly chaperone (PAC2) family protein